jgi:peptide-methionine (R)-S-oxide reductase
MTTRRTILTGMLAGLGVAVAARGWTQAAGSGKGFEVTHSVDEWRRLLTPEQFAVLRQGATERPYASPLLHEKRAGIFACAGCDLDLFASKTKYDSGTGWPSFWQALLRAVDTVTDLSLGMSRDEVRCHRCGGHLGHVFPDGPAPTGLRYCMNGFALTFKPAAA